MAEYNTILAAELDLVVKRGDVAVPVVYLTNPNNADAAFDLSGFTELTMHIKTRSSSSAYIKELTLTGGDLEVVGANTNGLQINITNTISDIPGRTYRYDVETNTRVTILEGYFNVYEDETKIPSA